MVNKVQSWSVHAFTASGGLAGFLSLEAILRDNIFLAFIWLSLAFFIDGIDGTFARRYKVKEMVPDIDGSILDNIVDYLNYVFIPAVMVYWFNLVPSQLTLLAVALILIVSCYTFANTKLKTEDNYFRGFPAVWNMIIFYLFVIGTSQLTNFLVIVFFSVMTFIPLKYLHPFRVKDKEIIEFIYACYLECMLCVSAIGLKRHSQSTFCLQEYLLLVVGSFKSIFCLRLFTKICP